MIEPPRVSDGVRARLSALRQALERATNPLAQKLPAEAPPSQPPPSSRSSDAAVAPIVPAATSGPVAPVSSAPSSGQKVWMALGLVWMTTLGAIPLLLVLWVTGAFFGVIVIAEALERTRGLAPTTFGGAFWLSCALVVLLIVLEVATWFPRDKARTRGGLLVALMTRPMLAAILVLLPTVLLVRVDLEGTDVPDIVTTTALLFLLGYGLFVLPIAFVATSIRLARWLWRVGSGSSFRGGLVAGVAAVLGSLFPVCTLCSPPNPETDALEASFNAAIRDGANALGDSVGRKGVVEGVHGALGRAAEVIPGSSGPWGLPPALLPDVRGAIEACVTELATSSRGRATVDKATDWLRRNKSTDRDTANAVAYATIWTVCRVHARSPLGDLEGYYWKAVKQNFCKTYQRDPLRECPVFDEAEHRCESDGFPFERRIDTVLDFRGRLCRLQSQDRDIILRTLTGETSAEIARKVGMTDANVRQRLRRALQRISDD